MPKTDRRNDQLPQATRQRTRGSNAKEPEKPVPSWNTYDPFTRATGAALRRLKRKQRIAEHIEEAPW